MSKDAEPQINPKPTKISMDTVEWQSRQGLQGRILTLIDASVENERQNKALKDSVKREFNRHIDWLQELADPEWRQKQSLSVK